MSSINLTTLTVTKDLPLKQSNQARKGGEETMKAHEYKVFNAENEQIDRVLTPDKNRGIAIAKLRHKYGNNTPFLRVEYSGLIELDAR